MKHIVVKQCRDCPHQGWYKFNDVYVCEEKNFRVISKKKYINKEKIPDWCPLQDYEGETNG